MKNESKVLSFKQSERTPGTNYFLLQNKPLLPFENCMADHSGKQFACIHASCEGAPNCFRTELADGPGKFHELTFHPDDRKLWCDKAFPDILRFIDTEEMTASSDYRVIFNHRYIRKDQSVSQFMHEGALIVGNGGQMPVLNLKVFVEIADIKQDETMIVAIFRYFADQGYKKVFSKAYSAEADCCLSDRELEIIKLCHKGMSSKMIAAKLNQSIHTVKNHKRNCMAKTNTHNISELIHLCILNRWL